jgi:3-oxoacyl-[acyl-carrier protein] reductase
MAVVTGGTRGIGRAVVNLLVGAGARVVVTARKQEELSQLSDAYGASVATICGGVDHKGHPEVAASTAVTAFGSLDILVNNAGTSPQFGPLVEADLGAFDKTIAVNLRAPLAFTQAAWRVWMRQHGGAIVNVASIGAFCVARSVGSYNVSKAGLVKLTEQLALELAPNVRVNAVAPGVVRTELNRAQAEDGSVGDPGRAYPLGRLGRPSEVAHAVAYLLSDTAAWITGTTMVIDGGSLLTRSSTLTGDHS